MTGDRGASRLLKDSLRALLSSRAAHRLVRAGRRQRAITFFAHRFANPAVGNAGLDLDMLRHTLAALRRLGVGFMSLRELVQRVHAREPLQGPTAVFTVDDGFSDFLAAAPVFAEFDCPVTVFLVSGFLDSRLWCWWNQIEVAFQASPRTRIDVECDGRMHHYALADSAARRRHAQALIEVAKTVPDAERRRLVDNIGALAEVDLPSLPLAVYAPMTWDDVRRLERSGVDFGPHTRSHPILSRLDEDSALSEVTESWSDLKRECCDPVPVFCYPNGDFGSFGAREMQFVERSGMLGAVAVYDGYTIPEESFGIDRYRMPRFALPEDPRRTSFLTTGLAPVVKAPGT